MKEIWENVLNCEISPKIWVFSWNPTENIQQISYLWEPNLTREPFATFADQKRTTEHNWHARIVENTFAKITVQLHATIARKVQMKVVIRTWTKSQVRLINPSFFKNKFCTSCIKKMSFLIKFFYSKMCFWDYYWAQQSQLLSFIELN